jgi:hypothetical protein
MATTTLDDLQGALGRVASDRQARAAIRRAARIVRLPAGSAIGLSELVRLCSALAAEGGAIQQLAEQIATDALRD